uniref:Uncharacterized protein n=1 Tax=Romanomermis culicivorax TaxID=13658 RepID=A0A915HLN1_ROMCU
MLQAASRKKECRCKKANNFINCTRKAPVVDICWYCEHEHNCGYKAVELSIYADENFTNSKHVIEHCCPKIEKLVLIGSEKCSEHCSGNWIPKTSSGKYCSW